MAYPVEAHSLGRGAWRPLPRPYPAKDEIAEIKQRLIGNELHWINFVNPDHFSDG